MTERNTSSTVIDQEDRQPPCCVEAHRRPVRYDFPDRLYTEGRARREAANLARGMRSAYDRGDVRSRTYLDRRMKRLRRAAATAGYRLGTIELPEEW